MIKITVAVIVTFNRLEELKKTLNNTLMQPFYRVVVIDNCSTDGTQMWLDQQKNDKLIVIHHHKNLGGAGGFHTGFRYVAEQLPEADWLVCFDDDAYPKVDMLEKFNSLDIPNHVGSLAGAVYLPSGQISEMNRPSRNPFWHLRELTSTLFRGRQGFHVDDQDYKATAPIEIDTSSFVGFFMRVDLIRDGQVGLPRSELFIYADDIIYVLQMRKCGYSHLFVPALEFIHDCQTLLDQKDVYHPLWKVYFVFRNRLEMYRVASGLFYPLILLVKIPDFFLKARHYPISERRQFIRITRQAVWDGLRHDYNKSLDEVKILSGDESQS